MGFGRAIVAALLVAAGASAAGNVSLVPSGFTSAEMVKRFHGFGGWHVEDRSCDKYVYGRLWDADCMKRRPPAGEILPLLVTGTPYTGTRSVAELFAAMDVEVDHERGRVQMDGGWAQFSAPARIGVLVREMRAAVDRLLERHIDAPVAEGEDNLSSSPVVRAVLELLATEGF